LAEICPIQCSGSKTDKFILPKIALHMNKEGVEIISIKYMKNEALMLSHPVVIGIDCMGRTGSSESGKAIYAHALT
jgi:hypothetical protein